MRALQWLSTLTLGALMCLLAGCGSGGSDGPALEKRTTFVLMRHCVRSTPWDGVSAAANLPYVNNYSAKPWPAFSVEPMFCLPRGADLIESQGRWWSKNGGFDKPIQFVADHIPGDEGQRDNVTMRRFMGGLGITDLQAASLNHGPFAPVDSAACAAAKPSELDLQKSAVDHLESNPPPASYSILMERLFEYLGIGAAGHWTGIPCTVHVLPDGLPEPVGACQAAAWFVERLLMQWGGNMTIGWGSVTAADIPELQLLHTWHFFNWFAPSEIARYFGTSMAYALSNTLSRHEGGTKIYVGHDSDLMMLKGALGLSWDPAPWPSNATLPGSMLHFLRHGDKVQAQYYYVQDFNRDDGAMVSTPVKFSSASDISSDEFEKLVSSHTIAACSYGASDSESSVGMRTTNRQLVV